MVNTNSQVMASSTSKASGFSYAANNRAASFKLVDNFGAARYFDSYNDAEACRAILTEKREGFKAVLYFKSGRSWELWEIPAENIVEIPAPVQVNDYAGTIDLSETPETKTIKAITRISKTYSCGLGTEIHLQIKNKETGHYCTMRFKLPTVKRDVATALVKEWIIKADEFLTVEVSADGKFDCTAFVDAVRYLQYQYAMANGLPVKWNKVPTDPWAKAVETDSAVSEAPETDSAVSETPEGKIDLSDEIYEQVAKSMAEIYSEFGYLCDDNDYMAFEVSCALDVDIDYVWEHINIDYKRLWYLAVRAGAEKIISDSILSEAEPVIKYIDEHLSDDHYFTDAVAVDKDAQGDDFDLERAIGNYLFYAIVDKDGEPRFDDSIIYKAVEQYNWTMDEDGDIYWTKKEPDSGFNKKIKVFEDGKTVVKSGNEYLLLGRHNNIIDSISESEFSNDFMNSIWAFVEDPCGKKEPDSGACKGSVVVESNKGDKVA